MKINGFKVPFEDGAVNVAVLRAMWDEKDLSDREVRWESWFKGFSEGLDVKARWYPIFSEAIVAFWSNKQYRYERISRETVVDMVIMKLSQDGKVPITEHSVVKALLVEHVIENTSLDHDETATMWQDAARGQNARLYWNPKLRAKFTAQEQ